jgi:hypothetical protein
VLEVDDAAIRVSAETSRRMACDASVVTMSHDAEGHALDVGRKTRTIPTAIRRAGAWRRWSGADFGKSRLPVLLLS